MCEAMLPIMVLHFFACFDLLNKELVVKSPLLPEDQLMWQCYVMSKAAGLHNFSGHVLKTFSNQQDDISISQVFPPASRQPPTSWYLHSAESNLNDILTRFRACNHVCVWALRSRTWSFLATCKTSCLMWSSYPTHHVISQRLMGVKSI